MGPLVAFLLGWGEHNAVAYDSDAVWLHLVTATPGVADRRGGSWPQCCSLSCCCRPTRSSAPWVGQRLDLLGGLLGLSVALLGAGYGLSSVMSVVLPYPVPRVG